MEERKKDLNFNPNEDEIKFIVESLDEYNFHLVEKDNHQLLNIVKYDENNHIIGGLIGGTYWGWMYVDRLWIKENYRKKGLGSELLEEAEKEAMRRGCCFVHLDTMSFHALGFYRKHHYKVKAVIKDIPKGHKKYIMIKKLK
jgi:ribosomal protein S18 acetylase RimI-like enzyme